MKSRFGPLGGLAKKVVLRILRFQILEDARLHADAQQRLARLEAGQNELAGLRASSLETARELVRVIACLNALAPRAELAAMRSALERKIDAVRLAQEDESVHGGTHRSYMKRELERGIRQAEIHRARVDATIDILLTRVAEIERAGGVPAPENGVARGQRTELPTANNHRPPVDEER